MQYLFLFLASISTYFAGVSIARAAKLTPAKVEVVKKDTVKAFEKAMVEPVAVPVPVFKPNVITGRLAEAEVKALAENVTSSYFPSVDPLMVRAMVEIESSRKPNATRYEPHLGESSTGLMQTLLSTAQDMAKNFGASKYGVPTQRDLLDPERSIYFGAAYLNWLRRFGTSEEQIVRNYNGGTKGYQKSATLPYWEKYKKAKAGLR